MRKILLKKVFKFMLLIIILLTFACTNNKLTYQYIINKNIAACNVTLQTTKGRQSKNNIVQSKKIVNFKYATAVSNKKSKKAVQVYSKNVNKESTKIQNKYVSLFEIVVNIKNQTVYVYRNNSLIKSMICSTGEDASPTPSGRYYTGNKGYSFYSGKYGEGAYYWTSFLGNYLFHSIPFDKNNNIIADEAQKLGTKASHGCVRLSIADAEWIYDVIPNNTLVIIQN